MHRQRVLVAHADNHVAENQGTAVGIHLHGHNVLVLHAVFLSVRGGHVDVALGGDHALGQLHFARRANQLAGARTRDIAGFTHRRGHTDGTRIRQGQLHLRRAANRAEDAHAGQGLLRADNVHALRAGILTGLGQHLLDGQLIALAEQGFQILLGDMNVTSGGFHDELLHMNYFLFMVLFGDEPNLLYHLSAVL